MKIKEIVDRNNEYKRLKQECDIKYKSLKSINSQIDIEELKQLTYEEIKEVYKMIRYTIENKDKEKQIEDVYNKARIKKYPILLKAHYYPIINEIDFLTDKQKRKLDDNLKYFYKDRIITTCSAWYELKLTNEQTQEIFQVLYDNKIVSKNYILKCTCGGNQCSEEYITEEQYNKFIEYHSVTPDEIDKMTDEQYNDYQERWDKEGYFYTGCWSDGEIEICNIDDLKKHVTKFYYENITAPDLTYENV